MHQITDHPISIPGVGGRGTSRQQDGKMGSWGTGDGGAVKGIGGRTGESYRVESSTVTVRPHQSF